ncbi:chemotaxis protein CheW [Ekhidna sp.]
MALGKNLKRRKLISNDSEAEKSTSGKKKTVAKSKELIEKPTARTKKKSESKKAATTTKKVESKPKANESKPKKTLSKTKKAPLKSKKTKPPKVESRKKIATKVIEKTKETVAVEPGLPIFIAKELYDLKVTLRKRYKEDVEKLKGLTTQFVVLQIGSELYAVDIDAVKEVVPISTLSKTPNTPEHIAGIANVRGSTYVVFDLTKKFKLDINVPIQFLLVLEREGVSGALSLNHLPTTRKVNGDNITSELHMIEDSSLDVSYIKGLIQDNDQLIYYLDVIELLKNDKAIVVPNNMTEH